jgi:hypothetical protein
MVLEKLNNLIHKINLGQHLRPYTKKFKMDHISKYKIENIKFVDERIRTKSM